MAATVSYTQAVLAFQQDLAEVAGRVDSAVRAVADLSARVDAHAETTAANAEAARLQAEAARAESEAARLQAEAAREQAEMTGRAVADLKQQLATMPAGFVPMEALGLSDAQRAVWQEICARMSGFKPAP